MLLVYLYFPLNAAERKCLYSPKFGWKIYLFTEILLYSPQCWWLGISVYPWMLRCRVAVPYQQVAAVAEDYQLQRRHQPHYSCSSVINHITAPAKGRHAAGNEVAAVHLYVTLLSALHHQAHIARRGRRVRKLQELCILYLTSPCQEQVAANKASGAMAANRQSGLWMRWLSRV